MKKCYVEGKHNNGYLTCECSEQLQIIHTPVPKICDQ